MAKSKENKGIGRARSGLLIQISLLLASVLVVLGLVTFFLINAAFNHLIEADKQDRIASEARLIYSGFDYIQSTGVSGMLNAFPSYDANEFVKAFATKSICIYQRYLNDAMRKMIEDGLMGLTHLFVFIPSGSLSEPMVIVSSDDALMYKVMPDYIVEALDEGQAYIFLEDGIPELGLEGAQLIALYPFEISISTSTLAFVGIRPMQAELDHLNSFYAGKKKAITWILAGVVGGGILVIFLIIFLVLQSLIRRNITEPIDELVAAAGEVMEGNLDVEIEVRKGEEFEVLKRAFQGMLDKLRSMIEKAVGPS